MRRFNMRSGQLAQVVALVVATGCGVLPAAAQRVVVFGDSLSDVGNAKALTGNFTPGATSPIGRYSNGLNWIDLTYGSTTPYFATGVGTGNINFAIGGARTDALAPNGFDLGITTQIGTFQAVSPALTAKDTVVIWGGANNLFQGLPLAAANPATAQTTLITNTVNPAVTTQLGNVQTLINAGARTLVVPNLPDFSQLPGIAVNGASFAGLAGFGSSSYNGGLSAGLSQIAASAPAGTNIIQVDAASLFKVVINNAQAFGFTNTTGTCQAALATCSTYVFWDSVHPTEKSYGILAQYVGLLSNPGPAIQQSARLAEAGLQANDVVTNQVFDRMSAYIAGTYAGRNGPYLEVIGSFGSIGSEGGQPGLDLHIGGVRAGLDQRSGATLTGGSVTALSGALSSGAVKSDITVYRGDLYGTAQFGNIYISGDAAIASTQLEGIERQTGIATVTASGHANGYVATVAAEAGILHQAGAWTIIPSARLTYVHSTLKGYSESADLLALSYDTRSIDGLLAGGRIRAVTAFGGSATAFGEIGYEAFLSSSSDAMKARFVNNTALPTVVGAGDPASPGFLGKLGISSVIGASAFLDVQYGIVVHDQGGETHTGDVRLKATY